MKNLIFFKLRLYQRLFTKIMVSTPTTRVCEAWPNPFSFSKDTKYKLRLFDYKHSSKVRTTVWNYYEFHEWPLGNKKYKKPGVYFFCVITIVPMKWVDPKPTDKKCKSVLLLLIKSAWTDSTVAPTCKLKCWRYNGVWEKHHWHASVLLFAIRKTTTFFFIVSSAKRMSRVLKVALLNSPPIV